MTHRRRAEAGSVTAELAVAMVAVGVVLAALASVVAVGIAQVRVADAAAAGARLASRGEPEGVVRSAAARLAGGRAAVTVDDAGDLTQVTVTRSVELLLPGRPTVRVDSRALGVTERGSGAAGTGAAGTSAAGTGAAGTSAAGTSAAGTGAAGTRAAGRGAAGTSAAGSGAAGALPVVGW